MLHKRVLLRRGVSGGDDDDDDDDDSALGERALYQEEEASAVAGKRITLSNTSNRESPTPVALWHSGVELPAVYSSVRDAAAEICKRESRSYKYRSVGAPKTE